MRLLPRSLAFRVIAFSTVWAMLALVVIGAVISTIFRQSAERGFDGLLSAHLYNLISSVEVSDDGSLSGNPNLGDLSFTIPRSGWYWSVEPVSADLAGALRSVSMVGAIPSAPVTAVPFDEDFRRSYVMAGLDGERVEVVESELVLDAENRVARFRVMGNLTELDEQTAAFDRQIYFYLALFGFGMIAINAAAILLGLAPLRKVRRAIAEIRAGRATRLDGPFPAEIDPLADETNALIESNRRIIERARTQVGNLAHSLKTPLAVLLNEGRAMGGDKGRLMSDQASAMQNQVEHYLQRARIAAQRDSVVFRTPVGPALGRLVGAMRKLAPQTDIGLSQSASAIVFAGEKEDLEEIAGNLVENAIKWASGRVLVRILEAGPATDERAQFCLVIDDDGPGIPEEKAREALKRGRRLDETKPGSGLGLAIVADLVKEYGGQLALSTSEMGGLKVIATLPAART